MEAYGTGWEERHQCGNTDKKNHSLTGNHEIVSLPQQTPRRRYIFISVFGNPLINMQASEGRVRVKRVRGSGGGKTNMRGWGYSPSIRCSAGQGAPPPPSPAAAAPGLCGAVAMEMWVRALMCKRSVDLALAVECKQLRLEPAVNSG